VLENENSSAASAAPLAPIANWVGAPGMDGEVDPVCRPENDDVFHAIQIEAVKVPDRHAIQLIQPTEIERDAPDVTGTAPRSRKYCPQQPCRAWLPSRKWRAL
jgi:hypothetical protein